MKYFERLKNESIDKIYPFNDAAMTIPAAKDKIKNEITKAL
jgi:hypothetical protein